MPHSRLVPTIHPDPDLEYINKNGLEHFLQPVYLKVHLKGRDLLFEYLFELHKTVRT